MRCNQEKEIADGNAGAGGTYSKSLKFNIPELDYLTIDEVADKWGCSSSDIEYLIFEEKTLRAAVVVDLVVDIQDDSHHYRFHLDSGDDGANEYPPDELPTYFYIDFNQLYNRVEQKDKFVPVSTIRLNRGKAFKFNNFCDFYDSIIWVTYNQNGNREEAVLLRVSGENFVITREERDRYLRENLGLNADASTSVEIIPQTTISKPYRSRLLAAIGSMVICLRKVGIGLGQNGPSLRLLSNTIEKAIENTQILSQRDIEKILKEKDEDGRPYAEKIEIEGE
jgi:hypothetical protein